MHLHDTERPGRMRVADPETAPPFEALVREHYAAVWRLVWRIVRDDRHADDVVERVFLSARSAFSGRDGEADAPSRLREIAVRAALADEGSQHTNGRPPREREIVERCLLSLDRSMRAAVALQLEGVTYEDAARILGVHVKTVRARLLLARTALHKCLSRKRAASA
jgi:DNA-directed RNA polymerase specialized sigma24 family protein